MRARSPGRDAGLTSSRVIVPAVGTGPALLAAVVDQPSSASNVA
jgi:hypothetical protein